MNCPAVLGASDTLYLFDRYLYTCSSECTWYLLLVGLCTIKALMEMKKKIEKGVGDCFLPPLLHMFYVSPRNGTTFLNNKLHV
jgi:hypothetical protein